MATPAVSRHLDAPHAEPSSLTGFGRTRYVPAEELRSEDLEAITEDVVLTRGLGRSYGDASLPARPGARVANSVLANRILEFDPDTGRLRAESGLSLATLNRVLLRRGWFTPVSPGTQAVTLGGMVAADVHGKNHHRAGSFGQHVTGLRLRSGAGDLVRCSPDENADLFHASIGGMGLTGHMLEVEFRMERVPTPWILGEVQRMSDFDALFRGVREAGSRWPFTVAWMDCFARGRGFGRGILIQGRWAEPGEAPADPPPDKWRVRIPMSAPNLLLNQLTGRVFYQFYHLIQRTGRRIIHPENFFYPLDAIVGWERLYGPRGFTQYQCALPDSAGDAAPRRVFQELADSGVPCFLSVVKDFGGGGLGTLSFPLQGFTFSFDVPMLGEPTRRLVDRLNEIVAAAGGRIYLAKDAFSRAEHFRAMEPRLDAFRAVREKWDPKQRLRSALSVRLLGDEA